jgi:hypothetical protein
MRQQYGESERIPGIKLQIPENTAADSEKRIFFLQYD